jgi:hypothetical protein
MLEFVGTHQGEEKCLFFFCFSESYNWCQLLFSDFRMETCQAVAEERNMAIIPPYDHYDVIAGQVSWYPHS